LLDLSLVWTVECDQADIHEEPC